MASFTSLLVTTDFSVDGNNAVRRAALLAHEHGARLHLLHVLKAAGCKALCNWVSPTTDINLKVAQARSALRRLAVETSGVYDVSPSLEVVVGDPFETLMQASQRAELVILGSSDGAVTAGSERSWSAERWTACLEPALVRSLSSRRRSNSRTGESWCLSTSRHPQMPRFGWLPGCEARPTCMSFTPSILNSKPCCAMPMCLSTSSRRPA